MKHNWKHIKFGDAFNLQMGKTPARANSAYWSNGLYDWVSISDMPNGKYIQGTKEKISQKAVDETGIHLVKKGTALMSFKLTIGKTAIAPYDLYTNEAIMAFEPKEGIDVLADFLYYYLQLYKWTGNRAVMGNTTNKGVIANSYASIPSLDEQQAIVGELDGINHLINLQEEQLREYDRLAQSLFYTTFGDPATNPKGWEVKSLGDIAEPTTGITYSPDDVADDGIIVLRSSNIQDNKLDFEDVVRVKKNVAEKYYVKAGDILMCSRNGSFRLVGKTAMVDNLSEKMTWGAFMTIIRSDYNPYLLQYFRAPAFREQLTTAKTTTVNQITIGMLKKIQLPIPPADLQQSFAAQIEAIEQQKALIRRSLDETRTLLAARMQYYFE